MQRTNYQLPEGREVRGWENWQRGVGDRLPGME